MSAKENTVVIILQAEKLNGHSSRFDLLTSFLKTVPEVNQVWHANGDFGIAEEWSERIRHYGVSKLILAGFNPGMHRPVFTRAMYMAGEDPSKVLQASFSLEGEDEEKMLARAKYEILVALKGVNIRDEFSPAGEMKNNSTLVVGGGIAGIQAALEIADSNQKVYLLEKTATIGGHMAMFDKTFPTLDCAACILTPKMVEVGQHPNIELLTYSELTGIKGSAGDYTATINKKARRVDITKCIGCGSCAEKCPSKVPSEFDAFTTLRKAIYIPFPQAVPNKYLIDEANCTYVQKGKCGVCVKTCPVDNCINLDEKDETVDINIGNIIIATGFKTFDPEPMEQYGYGRYPNVLTSLELERLINASGPTGGKITFRSQDKKGNWIFQNNGDERAPGSFAIIHCIGSRDINHHKYCSKVCCMYSLKLAHLLKEKKPDADVFEYFIDMRAFGKNYEEFYERIKEEGVNVIRGRTARITEKGDKLLLRSEDIVADRLVEQEVDMVILSVGLEPRDETKQLAEMLNLETDEYGWLTETDYNLDPTGTGNSGIHIAGVCQGPKDIPDTVAQASAASVKVLRSIITGKTEGNIENIDPQNSNSIINDLIRREE